MSASAILIAVLSVIANAGFGFIRLQSYEFYVTSSSARCKELTQSPYLHSVYLASGSSLAKIANQKVRVQVHVQAVHSFFQKYSLRRHSPLQTLVSPCVVMGSSNVNISLFSDLDDTSMQVPALRK